MKKDSEYGEIVVCDKCNQGCSINGYGTWFEDVDGFDELCPECKETV